MELIISPKIVAIVEVILIYSIIAGIAKSLLGIKPQWRLRDFIFETLDGVMGILIATIWWLG